ncbi:MAG: DUF4198 domain-containing protein [Bacteroidota bacterium]
MQILKKSNFTIPRLLVTLAAFFLLSSHDLYLKMDLYILNPDQQATISLYNGTFEKSENIITRDRMIDASVYAHGKKTPIDSSAWKDQDSTITQLDFNTGKAGTYVVGVSTKERNIALKADRFNSYLEHNGVLDMLALRKEKKLMDQDALGSYQKHVKAIYQVGEVKTDDWKTVLGYPIEMVPLANPYEKYSGEQLTLQLLLDGAALSNQLVYADYLETGHNHHEDEHLHAHDTDHSHEHSHDHDGHSHEGEHDHDHEKHSHTGGQKVRTNDQGEFTIDLPEEGIYYIRTIHMVEVSDSSELTHRSKWATLTFEVTHKHDESTHEHTDHDHEEEIPTWIFIVLSVAVIGGLYLFFTRKS